MLYRKIEKKLNEYYKDKDSRILIIDGARQVGKSFIIRETAKKAFKNYIEIDLKADSESKKLFKNVNDINEFYLVLSSEYGYKLNNNEDTIIFLDEIETYPKLITLLKQLKKDNRYRYIASGSLLGITLKHIFIPMGSIEEVKLYPLDFEEFLLATGCNEDVIEYLRECFIKHKEIYDGVHTEILSKFKEYLICGGLPAAVNEYIDSKNIYKIRKIQEEIFTYYKDDASQYDNDHKLQIRTVYDYMSSYMDNKVKRIQYKKISPYKRASLFKYMDEFDYLLSSGIAIGSKAVSNPKFPLMESTSKNLVKLYYNDVGILSNILFQNNIKTILEENNATNLGSLYETASALELKSHNHDIYYFDSKKVGEVDFLLNNNGKLLAIEIKSGKNINNFRAIPKLVKEPYNIENGYIFSNKKEIKVEGNLTYFPIYMIMFI